ncbi:MAG: M43 family zinc metalloprotease [Bacteroidota bacterium]
MRPILLKFYLSLLFCLGGPAAYLLHGQALCGTHVSPQALNFLQESRASLQSWIRDQTGWSSRTPDKILIQPHILLQDDGIRDFSEQLFVDALEVSRQSFLPMNVELEWCDFNYILDTELYFLEGTNDALLGKLASNNEPGRINIYFSPEATVNGQVRGGFAFLPGGPYEIVVLNTIAVDNKATLSHELGHFFGLYHTHGKTNDGTTDELVDGSNCGTAGDDLCDTPADPNLSVSTGSRCNYIGNQQDDNGDFYAPDSSNFMAYSPPSCRDRFSAGQYTRMRFFLENGREQLLSPEDCGNCLEVTSRASFGLNSLSAAIHCANSNPGPDTIHIKVEGGLIRLMEDLPPLVDDGTYIRTTAGRKTRLQAVADLSHFFEIQGANIVLENLDLATSAQYQMLAISVAEEAEDFVVKDLVISNARTGIAVNGAYGTITGTRFQSCTSAILFETGMDGIHLTENSFFCNTRFAIEGAENLQQVPPAPEISGFSDGAVFGKAMAGTSVELFAQNDGVCPSAACQGEYLGQTQADVEGNWTFEFSLPVIQSVTATATVESGAKRYTSDFAACWALIPEVDFWLYPNPVTGTTLNFELRGVGDLVRIRLLNSVGQAVYENQFEMRSSMIKESLDLGDWLAAGVYVFELTKGTEMYRQKIVIQ